MNKKLIELATEAGFPVSAKEDTNFSYRQKWGVFGSEEISLDTELEKFAELLLAEFVVAMAVNGKEMIK